MTERNPDAPWRQRALLIAAAAWLLALGGAGCNGVFADGVDAPQFLGDLARNLLAAWLF